MPELSDRAKALAADLAPMADAAGVKFDGPLAREAPALRVGGERTRPAVIQVINRCVELLNDPDGANGLFLRMGELVAWDRAEEDWLPMTSKRFRSWMEQTRGVMILECWKTVKDEETGEITRIPVAGNMSKDQAELVLGSDALRNAVPVVKDINDVCMPVMTDGVMRLLNRGYDRLTKTWTNDTVSYRRDMPLIDAMDHLYSTFRTFSWRDADRDWAVHLAGMLSLYCRGMYEGRAPMIAYNANIQESGKTRLATFATWATCGTRATKGLLQDQDATLEQTLNATAANRSPYLTFDNVDWKGAVVQHELLDQFVSNAEWHFRKMHSQIMKAPDLRQVVMMTGNNLQLSPDLVRRTIMADLWNAQSGADRELPKNAVLIDDHYFAQEENRSKALSAMWALVREWDAAGRPLKPGKVLGSFEDWSRVVPAIVWYAGQRAFKNWDCLAPNTANAEIGDKRGRDWKRLAEVAMAEFGKAGETWMPSYDVTVAQLVGVSRRNAIAECTYHLRPEQDLQAVYDVENKPGGWHYKEPLAKDAEDMLSDGGFTEEEKRKDRERSASEWTTPKARSGFGSWAKKNLHEKAFKAGDGRLYLWTHVPGSEPTRYRVTLQA